MQAAQLYRGSIGRLQDKIWCCAANQCGWCEVGRRRRTILTAARITACTSNEGSHDSQNWKDQKQQQHRVNIVRGTLFWFILDNWLLNIFAQANTTLLCIKQPI